jgi:hypothetical protein
MKIIITEEQQDSIKTKLQKMVKKLGWEKASVAVGGLENLAKLGFNNDPFEFLKLFNDLDVVQSEEKENWTLFRYKKHNNLMVYDRKNEYVYINYDEIWSFLKSRSFLKSSFGLGYQEIQELTKEWLGEVYNLRGVTTKVMWDLLFLRHL